jgi:hypothetical protein
MAKVKIKPMKNDKNLKPDIGDIVVVKTKLEFGDEEVETLIGVVCPVTIGKDGAFWDEENLLVVYLETPHEWDSLDDVDIVELYKNNDVRITIKY